MIYVEVIDSPSQFADIVTEASYKILCYLLSDHNFLDESYVDIEFKPQLEGQAAGYTVGGDYQNFVELAWTSHDAPYTHEEIMINLAHELVHVAQNIRGEACPGFCAQFHHLSSQEIREMEAYYLEGYLAKMVS